MTEERSYCSKRHRRSRTNIRVERERGKKKKEKNDSVLFAVNRFDHYFSLFLSTITIRRPLTRVSRALDIFLFLFSPPPPPFLLCLLFFQVFNSLYVCGARNVTQIAVYIQRGMGRRSKKSNLILHVCTLCFGELSIELM